MPQNNRKERQFKPKLYDDNQKRHADNNLGQHHRQHDKPHDGASRGKGKAGRRPRGQDAEECGKYRRCHRNHQAVAHRHMQRLGRLQHFKPFCREAFQRKGHNAAVIEGEDRQENRRCIEKHKKQRDIPFEKIPLATHQAMQGSDDSGREVKLHGDSGGKAELLQLLSNTKQPVMLACNEIMGLWGKGSTWRNTRDRFIGLMKLFKG